uniref:CARD domain-containing protein n=1 Tax=Amphilophus citrinellus TaxID=61819 RepID=A0A3Q0R749_AMPCI
LKEVADVRTEFVKRVTEESLKQLLEALERDEVLNDLETESILEENRARANKARCFIDTVKKKGDRACRIMIRHLKITNPALSNQLGLSSGSSTQLGETTFSAMMVPLYNFFKLCVFIYFKC